jgi:hypothetical protein
MKPYGVRIEEFPDVGDIHEIGAKSSVGTFQSKSGEYRGYCRSKAKQTTRRRWKRKARRELLADMLDQL